MKWKVPKIGDERTVKRFAWFPTYTGDGIMIWLEWYIVEQKYYNSAKGKYWSNKVITPIIK